MSLLARNGVSAHAAAFVHRSGLLGVGASPGRPEGSGRAEGRARHGCLCRGAHRGTLSPSE